MKKSKGMQLGTLLVAMLLLSMAFVPAVSAQARSEVVPTEEVGKAVKVDPPKIDIKENTKTSQIVQVDDILISLKANPQHTEAVMDIEDLQTKEKKTISYKISKKADKFTTEIYSEGELVNTVVTDYDPLESGVTSDVLKNNAKKIEDTSQITTLATSYYWDGVPFVKGSGIKYPHPDYNSYPGWEVWDNWYISGDQLIHYHLADWISEPIATLSPVLAGAAIGTRAGLYGAIAGAALGLFLGGSTSYALLDEEGCIWYWYSESWDFIIIPVPPFIYYLPEYFRISAYTLWDGLDIGNP